MKTIEITTRYEFLKPVKEEDGSYYIRVTTSKNNFLQPLWAVGRDTKKGGVAFYGHTISPSDEISLEKEYQEKK